MDRHPARIRPDPAEFLPGYQPRVVVKFRDEDGTLPKAAMAAAPGNPSLLVPLQMQRLWESFPEIAVEWLFSSVPQNQVREMVRAARSVETDGAKSTDGGQARMIPDLEKFYSVQVPSGVDPQEVIAAAEAIEGVEEVYLQSPPTPPPVNPGDDPRSGSQGHLDAAPEGIDARFAWTLGGGDGSGVGFVDLEQGWDLDHEDLIGAGITLISGVKYRPTDKHGTAVLGIVLGQDNQHGGLGIAPHVRARVVSQHRTSDFKNFKTGDAILSAAFEMRAGDVLLLEAQTRLGSSDFLPVEVDSDVRAAISIATSLGIIVVEAAGNGGTDLDTFPHPKYGFIFRRGHPDFRESGAIMVGAATSAHPHARYTREDLPSNYGSRIDCYGWGESIDTTGGDRPGKNHYTSNFRGTSGASAIVAGAAVALQGIVKGRGSQPWTPEHMRDALSNPNPQVNTPSANPATDRIGVMPNLRGIVAAESLAPAPSPNGGSPSLDDAPVAALAGQAVA